MAKKPGIFSRIVGFFTGKSGERVEREKEIKRATRQPIEMPKPATYGRSVSRETREGFSVATATMAELEMIIMSVSHPDEVRRAAQQRWLAIAPHPYKPHVPGLAIDNFWRTFRDLYHEVESRP